MPVDIFDAFPTVSRTAFTTYSLSVASVNSVGPSSLTHNVSVGKKNIKLSNHLTCMHLRAFILNLLVAKMCTM